MSISTTLTISSALIIAQMSNVSNISSTPHKKQDSPVVVTEVYERTMEENSIKLSSTAYLPPINLHKFFNEFHKSDFYKKTYVGKSLGDFIRIEGLYGED